MKYILLLSLALFFSFALHANKIEKHMKIEEFDTLPTSQIITFLQQMNIESYYGKPVDSFLLAIPANFYNMKVYGGSNSQGAIFRASEMIVDLLPHGNSPRLIIYVRQYTHMNRYSPTGTWDVNLFRKEKIYRIDVYKDQNTCINGWCLE